MLFERHFQSELGSFFGFVFGNQNLRVSCESRTRLAWLETKYLCRLVKDTLSRAPSGSRTRTSAMARRQAAATSWVHKTSGLYAVRKTNPNNWLCTPAEPHQQYPLQSHLCKKCFRVVIFKDQSVGVLPHQREHRARFELASPPYQGGILAARRPVHFLNVLVCIVNS